MSTLVYDFLCSIHATPDAENRLDLECKTSVSAVFLTVDKRVMPCCYGLSFYTRRKINRLPGTTVTILTTIVITIKIVICTSKQSLYTVPTHKLTSLWYSIHHAP